MNDYFAALQQARQPWIDPDALKAKYQELSRTAHPDGGAAGGAIDFATVTEGYRVLGDDKLRLQHLLKLEGAEVERTQALPADLLELFPEVGAIIQKSDDLGRRLTNTGNALSKSLLQGELRALKVELLEIQAKLRGLQEKALAELQALNQPWQNNRGAALAKAQEVYQRLSFLGRWIEQLCEREFRLAS